MKVLHIIDSGGLYGAEMVLLNLVCEHTEMGLQPFIASIGEKGITEKALETEAEKRGLRVQKFRMKPGPNVFGALDVLRYAHRGNFDVLHSHGYKGNILFGLMPDCVRKKKMVTTLHGWTWTGGFNRMIAYESLDGLSLRFINRVILVSEAMKAHPLLKRLPPERVVVIENGISLNAYGQGQTVLRSEILEFAGKGFSIVAVGRLSQEKGFIFLLEALAGLVEAGRDVRLAILGEGELRSDLEQKTKDLGIADRVIFAGYVNDARNYLGHFSLFCMPSLTEGLPMVLLEAMAAGVPVVATRVGGVPGILDHGGAGRLIRPRNVSALREAIADCMERPGVYRAQADAGIRRVQEVFSSRAMAEKYLKVYQDILSG